MQRTKPVLLQEPANGIGDSREDEQVVEAELQAGLEASDRAPAVTQP
jgi:hypothetical protein